MDGNFFVRVTTDDPECPHDSEELIQGDRFSMESRQVHRDEIIEAIMEIH